VHGIEGDLEHEFACQAHELTVSGGFTGDYLMEDPSGYVALGLYRTF